MLIHRLILRARARKWRKAPGAEVPSVCVGNVTVGGTGKTPHTELILSLLQESDRWGNSQLGVLSRGYKRRSRGFQQVLRESSAAFSGDEPLQIKKKFPAVTVAADKDRVEGCRFLVHPELLRIQDPKEGKAAGMSRKMVRSARGCKTKELIPSELIVLDDALQYNKLRASLNIMLVDWNRPVFSDRLLPFGKLRDLPSRLWDADIIIVTKCPHHMDNWEKVRMAEKLRIRGFEASSSTGTSPSGKPVTLLFSGIEYAPMEPVFPEADIRYSYSKSAVLFSGIANDTPLKAWLSDSYKIAHAFSFPDHHRYTRADISEIESAVRHFPTSALVTTEKDAQRVLDCPSIPDSIKQRLFYLPLKVFFSTPEELSLLKGVLDRL